MMSGPASLAVISFINPFPRLEIVYNSKNDYMAVKHGMKSPKNIQISEIS